MTRIALIGNQNSGKTTLFNCLTGLNQYVGNWPGVTVEKKEGYLKSNKDVMITDLPGIYSLSPYSTEEIVARKYLFENRPDGIINLVDASNLERNLFLTTQLLELGIPMVIALNMYDIIEKRNEVIDLDKLSNALNCKVIPISALKNTGIDDVVKEVLHWIELDNPPIPPHPFSGPVEHALAHIEEAVLHDMPKHLQRMYSVRLFQREEEIQKILGIKKDVLDHIEEDIAACEKENDDDARSIITTDRFNYISKLMDKIYIKKRKVELTTSDKIDKFVTNKWLALPIFALVIFLVYYISVTTVGSILTDFVNDTLFGAWILPAAASFFEGLGTAPWLSGLIVDGIISGVGAVLGFVPQMMVLFLLLGILEECGYMSRIAFILDRIFRYFGLSGKSFIPMLISAGCAVPGIMGARTIENERDKRMTVITTIFMPCSAKLPIVALIAGAFFPDSAFIAPSAYFIGIASVIISGIMLKKTKPFQTNPSPFVLELPSYHMPSAVSILKSMWDKSFAFIKKATTIILLSTIVIWFLSSFGWINGSFGMLEFEQQNHSILAYIGHGIAWIFSPLGWGEWRTAVASFTGLVAKENLVSTLGVLYGFAEVAEDGAEMWTKLSSTFPPIAGFSFLVFNLLCAPCFAAMGAIRREMNSPKWTAFALLYQTTFAWVISLIIYQLGMLFSSGAFGFWTIVAILLTGLMIFQLVRPFKDRAMEG